MMENNVLASIEYHLQIFVLGNILRLHLAYLSLQFAYLSLQFADLSLQFAYLSL